MKLLLKQATPSENAFSYSYDEKLQSPTNFWSITTKPFPEAHFAVYPEELCVKPIKSSCPPGGIVLDMFAGSGTTCLEAKKLGRIFVGIDINPEYIKIAKRRLVKEAT